MKLLNYLMVLIIFSYGPYTYSKNKPLRIAVIDTGFDFQSTWSKYHKKAKDYDSNPL